MISTKRLIKFARKWQKMAAIQRRRISFSRRDAVLDSLVASKGHFVVYTIDKKRFEVPLRCLSSNIIRELFRMSEEEFGLPSGSITLACDSTFLEYVISLVQGRVPEVVEKSLLTSMATCLYSASSSLATGQSHQQTLIYGF